jgi:hypothetical protein
LGWELQEGRRIRNKQTNVSKNMRKNQINKHTNNRSWDGNCKKEEE